MRWELMHLQNQVNILYTTKSLPSYHVRYLIRTLLLVVFTIYTLSFASCFGFDRQVRDQSLGGYVVIVVLICVSSVYKFDLFCCGGFVIYVHIGTVLVVYTFSTGGLSSFG